MLKEYVPESLTGKNIYTVRMTYLLGTDKIIIEITTINEGYWGGYELLQLFVEDITGVFASCKNIQGRIVTDEYEKIDVFNEDEEKIAEFYDEEDIQQYLVAVEIVNVEEKLD